MARKLSNIVVCSLLGFFVIVQGKAAGENVITIKPDEIEKYVLANSVNDFGYKLMMQMIKENEEKNVVISPTGIAALLAMNMLGSVGRSYDELAETLGFSQDVKNNRRNHELFGDLLRDLNTNNTFSKTMFADGLFIDEKSKLREAYRSYLARVYQGDVIGVDFSDSNKAIPVINEWVSNSTRGKISDFIPLNEPLSADTKTVLLSSLYFSGQWKKPFLPKYTSKEPFKRTKDEVMTDMMLTYGRFNCVESWGEGISMVALPYNDSVTTMYALLPLFPEKKNLTETLKSVTYSRINQLIDQMSDQRQSMIKLPKMDLKAAAKLENPLRKLGINSIFVSGQANFALMIDGKKVENKTEEEILKKYIDGDSSATSTNVRKIMDALPNPGVHVDSLLHDVRITIDEYGTEAVAEAMTILLKTVNSFYAFSPFYIFIRNEETKLVTFSAVIFDPTM